MDLRGAVALVTGGQRIRHALAKEGVHVAVMYAQSCDQCPYRKSKAGDDTPRIG